jgi:hypothetical protein
MLPIRTPPLFDLVPKDLFRPLASANREHYWQLLHLLYARFFGPEADMPPPAGWNRRDLLVVIEQQLEEDDPWEIEEGEVANTPTNIRAHNYLSRLIKAGWLLEERVGLAVVISMPTIVARLMETLQNFIEFSPPAVGAKMRSIEGALQRVLTSRQPGADLDEAATQARQLVGAMASMGVRLRELMRGLTADVTTAQALRRIFDVYIADIYMADYAQLTGADHPLARKSAVIALANEIDLGDHRGRLVAWYAEHRTSGNLEQAEDRLQRTLRRIKDLNRLQDFLDRLEDDLRRMNRRMLALIDYRLHTPSHLETRIKRAIEGVKHSQSSSLAPPIGPGQILSGELLYKPRRHKPPIPVVGDRQRQMTPEQEARMRLRAQALAARRVQSKDIYDYLHRVMGTNLQTLASDLSIESVKDFRVVQTLASMALAAIANASRGKGNGTVGKLPRYAFRVASARHISNGYLDMPDFYITKVG